MMAAINFFYHDVIIGQFLVLKYTANIPIILLFIKLYHAKKVEYYFIIIIVISVQCS